MFEEKVKEIILETFHKETIEVKQMSSLSNYVYRATLADDSQYIVKIKNNKFVNPLRENIEKE